jgi:hypothetical protein
MVLKFTFKGPLVGFWVRQLMPIARVDFTQHGCVLLFMIDSPIYVLGFQQKANVLNWVLLFINPLGNQL